MVGTAGDGRTGSYHTYKQIAHKYNVNVGLAQACMDPVIFVLMTTEPIALLLCGVIY